jgi:amino-acid N-acetyltransferase
MTIDALRESDLASVHIMLRANSRPLEGFNDHFATALVAREQQRVIGSAALEMYAPYALLRSVAVDASHRGQGIGRRLTTEALALAHRQGVERVYLLTDTAAAFFPKLGFREIARSDVRPSVRQSVEFTSARPETATAMVRDL